MGLDQLVGPGAWDSYEEQTYPELARTAEAQPAEKKADKPAGAPTEKPIAAPLLGSPEGQAGATIRPPDKPNGAQP